MRNFFMIKTHPCHDIVMVQVGNEKIELISEDQKTLYNFLKKRLEEN